jgi:hypothetical protein
VKRILMMIVVLVAVTGCSSKQPPGSAVNSFTNLPSTQNNVTTSTNNTDSNATADGGIDTTSGKVMTDFMTKTASGLIDQYITSHNLKTLPEYKVAAHQIFAIGMADQISAIAQSGVDYNHPVQSYTIKVLSTQMIDQKNFVATVQVDIQYKGEAKQRIVYHGRFVLYNGDWFIRSV